MADEKWSLTVNGLVSPRTPAIVYEVKTKNWLDLPERLIGISVILTSQARLRVVGYLDGNFYLVGDGSFDCAEDTKIKDQHFVIPVEDWINFKEI